MTIVLFALVLVYYHGVFRMGLYEDDYVNVSRAMDAPWSEIWAVLKGWAVDWPAGRPLGNAAALVIPFFLYRVGGMSALYLLPFAALAVNSTLLYVIVARRAGFFPGFVAALTFALLPTDTLRLSLHATPELQFAIFFLLLGTLAFQGRRWWLSYPCLIASMLCHESATLSFFAIPLLSLAATRASLRRYVLHATACVASIGAVLATRGLLINEVRTRSVMSDPGWILQRMFVSITTGTETHLKLLLIRPVEVLRAIDPGWMVMIVLLAAAIIGAYMLGTSDPVPLSDMRRQSRALGRLSAVGALFFALPYLAYITDPYWPANHTAGRIASVHTASGVGVALLAAAVATAILMLPRRSTVQRFAIEAMAVYLAFLLGWGHVVAQQYRQAWTNERAFWSAMVPQLGPIRNHTLIFFEQDRPGDVPQTWIIGGNSWADSVMLRNLYRFPWYDREPRLFTVSPDWRKHTRVQDGRIQWYMPRGEWQPGWVDLEPGNVILVRPVNGRPARVDGVLHVSAGDVPLMPLPPSPGEPPFPHRALHRYMITSGG